MYLIRLEKLCRKQVKNKVSSLEDYAVEIIQEVEKILTYNGDKRV
jgi:hypothetical protein